MVLHSVVSLSLSPDEPTNLTGLPIGVFLVVSGWKASAMETSSSWNIHLTTTHFLTWSTIPHTSNIRMACSMSGPEQSNWSSSIFRLKWKPRPQKAVLWFLWFFLPEASGCQWRSHDQHPTNLHMPGFVPFLLYQADCVKKYSSQV